MSNANMLARATWSMPPDHGAAAVRTILEDKGLTAEYNGEGYSRHTFSVEAHDPAGWAAFTAKETP